MQNIDLSYETTGESIWGEPLSTIVFSVNEISPKSLVNVIEYLIERPTLRTKWPLDDGPERPGALEVALRDGSRVSESSMWHLIYDTASGGEELAERYVAALIDSLADDEDLPHCSVMQVVGQHPVYAYMDSHWEELDSGPDEGSRVIQMLTTFLNYLKHCDIDHEPSHRRYVEHALSYLGWQDEKLFLRMLKFWIDTDQRGTENVEFEHISQPGRFKTLVDHVLATKRDEGWALKVSILELCAVAYGSNMALTEDVLNYCRKKANIGDGYTLINFEKGLLHTRQNRDRLFLGSLTDFDSGFHRYTADTDSWEVLIPDG